MSEFGKQREGMESKEHEKMRTCAILEYVGDRPTQQDAYAIEQRKFDNALSILAAVADGHGVNGATMSEQAVRELIHAIGDSLPTNEQIVEIFQRIHEGLAQQEKTSGTTLTLTIINQNEILTAHVGDSEARLIKVDGSSLSLAPSHRVGRNAAESERLQKAAAVINDGYITANNDTLEISRSLGDPLLSEYVSHVPDISKTPLSPDDRFVLIGSDGFWDFFEEEEGRQAIEAVFREATDAKDLKRRLQELMGPWRLGDNLTLIIAELPQAPDRA